MAFETGDEMHVNSFNFDHLLNIDENLFYVSIKFPCVVCRKKFSHKAEMKKHVRRVHLAPVAWCGNCGSLVKRKGLKKHMSKHSASERVNDVF